jgi:demethylmenaquinone methyltransferase/2-methoxy-6-polyprenyl-1,4-benzoquinol methylase
MHFMRTLRWLREVGLEYISTQTFVHNVHGPLDSRLRTALTSLFEMLWVAPESETPSDDWNEFQRLCKPESPDFILDLPDYSAFFTYTLFRGTAPESKAG